MPSPNALRSLIEELLIPHINRLIANPPESEEERAKAAWWVHDFFECVHPFIDGNGRTGRILLNAVRVGLGLEPLVVYHRKYHLYAHYIQRYRRTVYEKAVLWLRKDEEGPKPVRFN